MELDRVKILIERYLEAETTLDEERELAEYFATHDNIPEEYESLRAMFQVFDDVKVQHAPEVVPSTNDEKALPQRRRWWLISGATTIAAAAACLIVILIPPAATIDSVAEGHGDKAVEAPKLICHIDGQRVTNDALALDKANKILGGMADNMQLAMAEIEKFNFIIK